MKSLLGCVCIATLAGCCTSAPLTEPPGTSSVSVVVNKLKRELNLFLNTHQAYTPPASSICNANGTTVVSIVPTTAQLVLKVTSTNTLGGDVGAKIPAGSIVTVDPKFTGSYQTVGTQTLTLDLDIKHPASGSEAQSEVDNISKQIDSYARAEKVLQKSDPGLAASYKAAIVQEQAKLHRAYLNLAQTLPRGGRTDQVDANTMHPAATTQPAVPDQLNGHTLASTLWVLREQLLRVDHSQTPCLKPHQLKADLGLEIVKDEKAELGIDIYIVSVDANKESKADTLQTLSVTFDMTASNYGVVADND